MPPRFTNMNELTAYLETLEQRLDSLERENRSLLEQRGSADRFGEEPGGVGQKPLPGTGLLSPSFIKRAFTVWGHYFVAQLIISIPVVCIYFAIVYYMLQQGINLLPTP